MECTNVNRAEILKKLADHRVELKSRFAVSSLSIFGSVARGYATEESDLDILVSFQETPGLLKFLELKAHLENLFQCRVDLVTKNALKKQLREQILKEALDVI
ncbi:MAG: nucleotidyltransferase [Desulfobacteraceae bacterium]|nr:MAG: nucleotidyltransferase [Desulfobacteraceae bacterium]